jgi:DNA-binding NtrC family response regulator
MPLAPETSRASWPTLEQMEERYIREVVESTGGNISRAAEILGIDRRTLYRRLDKGTSLGLPG